jgi:prepilin signal peptidase PulO-like enzyme (type II secretory pathway)
LFHLIFTHSAQAMGDMPLESGWLALVVLVLLGAAALIDLKTGRIPDALIFFGLVGVTLVRALYVDWQFAANHLTVALVVGFAIYGINLLWYQFRNRDALGMGDAKWTMLAVATFGWEAPLIAWVVGAWLALFWMGGARLIKRPLKRVHFAPFLFLGLFVGIYLVEFRLTQFR